jgi:RNA polymerase sigma-70 factor (ECF subfamily)
MSVLSSILESCKKGDRKAQFRLYQEYYPVLMSVCMRYRKDKSEAVALLNTGFLKIITNLHQYRTETPFEAWIRKIMINTLIDDFRANSRKNEIIEYREQLDHTGNDHFLDYNLADQLFDAEQLESVIQQLPPMARQVFNLFAIDGYAHKEISTMLSISEGTSKWHLNFARNRLQEILIGIYPELISRMKSISNK